MPAQCFTNASTAVVLRRAGTVKKAPVGLTLTHSQAKTPC
jgi:hypothetical protein